MPKFHRSVPMELNGKEQGCYLDQILFKLTNGEPLPTVEEFYNTLLEKIEMDLDKSNNTIGTRLSAGYTPSQISAL